jgi:hypothetical protein
MAYAEVEVIVNGALDSTETFFDETLLSERIEQIRQDAESDGYPTEVFITHHEHDPRECECAQYVTDHHPAYSWNV